MIFSSTSGFTILLICLSCFCSRVSAQPVVNYVEHLTTNDGLSSNCITDILQGPGGFLWIGTTNGLNRYDGSGVKKYFGGSGPDSLTGNTIYRMLPAGSDHIAIATDKGLSILNAKSNRFRHIFFKSDTLLWSYANRLDLMEKDALGNFWIGTPSVIYKLDKNFNIQKKIPSGFTVADLDGKRNIFVYKIVPVDSGNVLFWLRGGVYLWQDNRDTMVRIENTGFPLKDLNAKVSYFAVFEIKEDKLIFLKYDTGQIEIYNYKTKEHSYLRMPAVMRLPNRFISNVAELPDGALAFTFSDLNGTVFMRQDTPVDTTAEKIYLPDFNCGKWLFDSEGNYWVSTPVAGLLKITPSKQKFNTVEFREEKTGKPYGYEIISIVKLKGRVFVGTGGDGFYIMDTSSGEIIHQNLPQKDFPDNIVWNFRQQADDTLWIGTQTGLMWYNTTTREMGRLLRSHPAVLDSFAITTQYTDSRGLVWIGIGLGNGVAAFDPAENTFTLYPNKPGGYPYRYPLAIDEDAESNLWFVSDVSPCLVKYTRKENRFRKIPLPSFKNKPIVATGALCIDRSDDVLWYGVRSVGLVRYAIHTGDLRIYRMRDNLGSDRIFDIEEDENGILWMNTSEGITSFDPAKETFTNYDRTDGLPDANLHARLFYDEYPGIMYTGAPGRIIYFSPAGFTESSRKMKVLVTELMVNNSRTRIPDNRKLTLPFDRNNITIFFTGINLANGKDNVYEYKILDNSDWIETGHQRQVQLASLNPGHYHFVVRAAAKGRQWTTNTDFLDLYIMSPFYKTPWFYALCFLIPAAAVYAWYKYRMFQMLKLQQMRSDISRDLHDEIGSRLTNINMISQIAGRQRGLEENGKLLFRKIQEESEEITQSMRDILWNINPENDSMEELVPRMLRFASGLLESKNITLQAHMPDLPEIELNMEKRRDLFLIFKEVVHNILKHSEATQVIFSVQQRAKHIQFWITDNGKGFDRSGLRHESGLRNMTARAGKHHWELRVSGKPGEGTEVLLQLKQK